MDLDGPLPCIVVAGVCHSGSLCSRLCPRAAHNGQSERHGYCGYLSGSESSAGQYQRPLTDSS